MDNLFNYILDINGENKVYPADKKFYTLFFTADSRFFIYALYTKPDFSDPELIEIDFDCYMNLREEDIIENFAENINVIADILLHVKHEVVLDNLSVGQILNLNKK